MFSYVCEVCKNRIHESSMWHCPGCAKHVCDACLESEEVTSYAAGEFHIHCGGEAMQYVRVVPVLRGLRQASGF